MNKYLQIFLILLVGIAIGFFLGKIDTGNVKNLMPLSCTYKGEKYKDGEGFQDECNSCTCENGEVICTLMACESDIGTITPYPID